MPHRRTAPRERTKRTACRIRARALQPFLEVGRSWRTARVVAREIGEVVHRLADDNPTVLCAWGTRGITARRHCRQSALCRSMRWADFVPMSCSQGPVLCCTGTVLTCGAFAFRIRYRCLPELSDIPPGTLRRVPLIIIVPSIMTRSNDSDSFSTDVGPGAPAVQCLATSSYVRSVSAMVGAASMCAALWMAEAEDRAPQPISRGKPTVPGRLRPPPLGAGELRSALIRVRE